MKEENKEFDLNMHTARLLMEEPFFAALSRRIDKRASRAIPTAGVMVNEDTSQFEMLYNPEWFAKLSNDERKDVLKHEFYHIIFKHVTDRMPQGVDMKTWNIAADLAINSHLYNLPEGGCVPGEGLFKDLPRGESAEWYLKNMPNFAKNKGHDDASQESNGDSQDDGQSPSDSNSDGSSGNNMPQTLDDHSGWGKVSQKSRDVANERLKDIVKKAAHEASSQNSWGSVSASVKEKIMDSISTKVDWRKVLRYFVKASQKANKRSSIKRINKRYPYIHSGKKTDRVAKVAVSIDQSGSVDDGMLAMFFAELTSLAEYAEFTVVPFDTQVAEDKVYTWKKGETRKVERVLTGGTCFDAPTKYVNDRSFDGHIVLTDMCAPKPKASKCQRMWMTTRRHASNNYFSTNEKVVVVD